MLNRFAPNKKFLKWHMDEKLNHRFLMIEFLLPKGCVKYSADFHRHCLKFCVNGNRIQL